MFKQVRQNKAYQGVVEQIEETIVAGTLKPGSLLPAERELKEQFGVSRGTLREALRVLEQKGLIEIRTGVSGGSVVREVNGDKLSENIGLLIRNRTVSLQDLATFREGIEGGVAALAAQRASEGDIAFLRELLGEAEGHLKLGRKGWNAFIRTDEKLHMALARISANQLYISVLESVYSNIHTYYDNYLSYGKQRLQENYDDLRGIVEAVAAGEGEKARKLAQGHVERFNAYMEKKGAT
ncbi:FadR family transcriptional regulator [Geobacter chapellei]|uniref:FadR family transcriptional regulator n=2 Tax=Pelotalea chapellei TaxID=44671 RepID=A0ABS5UBA2_9BACT|nr:FadR family transcriptional regulator [Pelotalea chapellei]